MKRATLAIVASFIMMLGFMQPVQAHEWYPSDGGGGYTSRVGCDGPDSEPDWIFNDGRVCWRVWYYDHSTHLHVDHVKLSYDPNYYHDSDSITSITGQRVRIYSGLCTTTFPKCYNNGEVTGPIYSSAMPNMTDPSATYTESIGIKGGKPHALVVVDYEANGLWHMICCPSPVNATYYGQEEIHL